MFNLLIHHDPEFWNSSPVEFDKSRAAVEYTVDNISERYKFFTDEAIEELKQFPCLFVVENEQVPSRIGKILNLRVRSNTVVIEFQFDAILPELSIGAINDIGVDIDLGKWEISRTHWAIKDEDLFEILLRKNHITLEQLEAYQRLHTSNLIPAPQVRAGNVNKSQVFIVHGHNELVKLDMSNFISSLGLEPIILHQQASSGRTIIEKIEAYSNVGFAIVLYTPCDVGSKVGELNGKYRARQNVVFEHGYLIGKLGREKVAAVVKGDVETPNDISGVVYINFDDNQAWKNELITEIRSVGYDV